MKITFTIPGEPKGKERARVAPGQPRPYTPKQTVQAEKAIRDLFRREFPNHVPITGPVMVRFTAIFAIPPSWPAKTQAAARRGRMWHVRSPDKENIEKLIWDALKRLAWVDDSQAMGGGLKRYGFPERTEVTIEAMEQEEDEKTPGQRRLEKRIEVEGWDAVLAPPKRRKKPAAADSSGLAPGYIESIRGTVAFKPGVLFGRRGKR